MTETPAHISANSVPKISPAMARQIRAEKRRLRKAKRGLGGGRLRAAPGWTEGAHRAGG